MPTIDLRPFGFDRAFTFLGRVIDQGETGDRLLFLFDEEHHNRQWIGCNVLNACDLDDLGLLGFVGVEGHEELDLTRPRPERVAGMARCDRTVVIQELRRLHGFFFGGTLKRLRPALNVRCVEDTRLYHQALSLAHLPGYRDNPIHLQRERTILANLWSSWPAETDCAAILNLGYEHHDRIAQTLRNTIRYIRIRPDQSNLP